MSTPNDSMLKSHSYVVELDGEATAETDDLWSAMNHFDDLLRNVCHGGGSVRIERDDGMEVAGYWKRCD